MLYCWAELVMEADSHDLLQWAASLQQQQLRLLVQKAEVAA